MSNVAQKAESQRPLVEQICAAMSAEIAKLGLSKQISPPRWEHASFSIQRDPALGDESLEGLWLSDQGGKLGSVTIHSDGSFFAEYDIIRPHPAKPKWFVEAVSSWGRENIIKSEARLLRIPD